MITLHQNVTNSQVDNKSACDKVKEGEREKCFI